jgi:hypothetical protein
VTTSGRWTWSAATISAAWPRTTTCAITIAVQRRHAFFSELRAEGRFEVEAFSVDYQGRRLRRQDRSPEDDYIPAERCVDVALAVTVMRYVMTPAAVDLVILVAGDSDFVPLLREVRRIGKRVAVVSIEGACADELSRPGDRHGVRDFDVLWLDDLGEQIEKWRARGLRHETEPAPTESAASATAVLRGRIQERHPGARLRLHRRRGRA